jgi:hypothetical protein
VGFQKALPLAAAMTAAAVIPFSAAAAGHSPLHFKVTSATVSATLTFHTSNADASETSNGTIVFSAKPKGAGSASVPGRAVFPLDGKLSERVVTTRKPSDTSPYQETCKNTRKVGGSGGMTLRKVGSRVEARWGFPQASPAFCHGPKAGKSITNKMTRVLAAAVFNSARPTVTLAGSAKSTSGSTTLSYRWRAVVKLARS